MNISLISSAVILSMLVTTVDAQDESEYEQLHRESDIERQAIVAENLPLLDSEAEVFWGLYLEYRTADREFDDQRVNLIGSIEGLMIDLADDEGLRLVTEALDIERKRQALKQSYLMKFSSVLPGAKLFRYYQIETKLDALKRYFWTSTIELVPLEE